MYHFIVRNNMAAATRGLFLLSLIASVIIASCTPIYRQGGDSSGSSGNSGKNWAETGEASWYGGKFHGRQTASGEVYDMHGISAAHKTLPLGTQIRVTNLTNNRQLVMRINDRGPFVKGRIIDCSREAARQLGFLEAGITQVRIEVISWPAGKE
jgi:rare lipoprotein A